jgi:outer membrane receptor protein involved in Fe transport
VHIRLATATLPLGDPVASAQNLPSTSIAAAVLHRGVWRWRPLIRAEQQDNQHQKRNRDREGRTRLLLGALAFLLPHLALAQTVSPNAASPAAPSEQPTTPAPANPSGPATTLPQVNVIAPTPLLGSGVDRNKVPAQNQVLTDQDVTLQGPPSYLNALKDVAQGVHLDSAAGGPFQPNLFYHGFQASPLQGTPQGIAVYLNGVRFNQAFGDTVNFDLIPDIAIDTMNLEGANPAFGLNALGGSLAIQLKNGFTYHGGELDVYGGSFNQVAGAFQYGKQAGNTAVYVAVQGLHEDGWRDFQSSGLKQFYGDVGWRSNIAEVHLNVALAQTTLQAPGTTPVEWLAVDPRAEFTGPSPINNAYTLVSLNGNFQISDTTSVQALAYYDYFLQRVGNGNVADFEPCNTVSGFLCEQDSDILATDRGGNPIPDFLNGGPYSDWDSQVTNTNGYGVSAQVTNENPIFGHHNHLVVGASFDGSNTLFGATTGIGGLDPVTLNFIGPAGSPQGIIVDQADGTDSPVRVGTTTGYYGVYVADIFDITSQLSANVSARFNAAQIDLNDMLGTGLSGNHSYTHFNPSVGMTYRPIPAFGVYASYSVSNRAPTPAELSCASPASPCSLANFFTGDPDLKQVVAHTIEAGFRGTLTPFPKAKLDWNLSFFHSNLDDDIQFVQSVILGRGFFQNVGATRRQGVDASLQFTNDRWKAWFSYTYTNATFQSAFAESSPNNPGADADGNIQVSPGNRLPGIPANLVKFGVQYKATPAWTIGATAIAASGQYLFGDEANLTKQLPGYFVLNLNTSYQITPNIQLFGLVQNVTDTRYYIYGTFAPTSSITFLQAPGSTNTRSYNIAAPIGGFGGIRVTF